MEGQCSKTLSFYIGSIEDHRTAGPKTMSLSSPGHAVSPFRMARFGKDMRCEVVAYPKGEVQTNGRPMQQNPLFLYRF